MLQLQMMMLLLVLLLLLLLLLVLVMHVSVHVGARAGHGGRVVSRGEAERCGGRESADLLLLEEALVLASRPILVVRMVLHVNGAQTLGLVNVRPLLLLVEHLPLGAEALADLRVVHLRVLLGHLAPLAARPHHERVHGPLHSLQVGCRQLMRQRRGRPRRRRRRRLAAAAAVIAATSMMVVVMMTLLLLLLLLLHVLLLLTLAAALPAVVIRPPPPTRVSSPVASSSR